MKKSKYALLLLSCASDMMDDYLAHMKAIKADPENIESVADLQAEIDAFISCESKRGDELCNPEKYWA